MNKYESIIITKPTEDEEKKNEIINKYKGLIETFSDKKIEVEDLGKRKLAYEVKGNKEGNYVNFHFYGEVANVAELERHYRIDDDVLKYLTLKEETLEDNRENEDEDEEEESL